MDEHKCQLCYKDFPNGKALESHMRSHMMNSHALKSSSNQEQEEIHASKQEQALIHSHSSSSEDDEEQEQENPKKSAVDSEHSTAAGSTVLQDGESEEVPSREALFIRVFKKARKTLKNKTYENSSSFSSTSTLTPEENGAVILMMLSRDTWDRDEKKGKGKEIEIPKFENDNFRDSDAVKVAKKSTVKGKYICETCNLSFRSYQALGGHNAKHKRINEEAAAAEALAEARRRAAALAMEERTFECPYCQKVFPSGQALGGHKRSHFSFGALKPVPRNDEKQETKLNRQLPASDERMNQTETSAASDEEMPCEK